ncbi:MAG: DNA-binding domain-containing protein [Caldimonas sp.]
MPSLRELQQSFGRSMVAGDEVAASTWIVGAGLAPRERVGIYRNTFLSTVTRALRLTFPAVHRLVGADFFEGAAQIFTLECPPRGADLNAYGEDFASFLERFAPASALAYLPDLARLEWAVNRALHAPDARPLDVTELSGIGEADQARLCFTAHPSVSMIRSAFPVDAIWQAVLEQDDQAMGNVNLSSGPVFLLVERLGGHVDVSRLDVAAWNLSSTLFEGVALGLALEHSGEADAPALLAAHLLAGRFISYSRSDEKAVS